MVNMFSGGALERLSIFALGVMPDISASIIIQMMGVVHAAEASIKKEGESGRRKLTKYTRYGDRVPGRVQGSPAQRAASKIRAWSSIGGSAVHHCGHGDLIAGTMFRDVAG